MRRDGKKEKATHRNKKLSTSELESAAIRQRMAANGIEIPLQKCDLVITARRRRYLDEGNHYYKPLLDRLTEIGILQDDSKKYITSITVIQEKVKTDAEEALIMEFTFQ